MDDDTDDIFDDECWGKIVVAEIYILNLSSQNLYTLFHFVMVFFSKTSEFNSIITLFLTF